MRISHTPKLICMCVLLTLSGQPAFANPLNPVVINGQASFVTTGNALTVTNTPGAIINWQGFSIGAGEITRFNQQSAASAVLNRVISNNPSSILGSLQSNGRVFLINPNGIVFGAGATVDVSGLVASTLNLSNADFLAGNSHFTPVPGAANISNAGNITAQSGGQIYLIAPNVENTGVITAANGAILLAAGHSVDLVNTTNPALRVSITAPAGEATNIGQLIAGTGSLGLFGTVVRNSGQASADSATMQGGKIVFKATGHTMLAAGSSLSASGTQGGSITVQSGGMTSVSGNISAAGSQGSGGTVNILGNQVGLVGAKIDASGNSGGTVLVGGNFHGAGPEQNAGMTSVDVNTVINADATTSGNGGNVAVWADNSTQFAGSIFARGGANSGGGGFVETSAASLKIADSARINTSAAHGLSGTWLLDPVDFTIAATSGDITGAALGGLLGSNSITIHTATGTNSATDLYGTAGTTGNITVSDPVAWANANSLTLSASNNISINAALTGTGGGLFLNAPNGTVTSSGGYINVNNLQVISSGNVSITGLNQIGTVAASVTGTGSTFTLENANNNLIVGSVTNALGTTNGVTSCGNATIWQYTAGGVTVNQNVTSTTGLAKIGIASGSGAISVAASGAVSGNGVQVYTSGGAITLNGNLTDTGTGGITIGGTGSGAISGTGAISTTGLLTAQSVGGASLSGANTVGSFKATNTGSGNVTFTDTAATLTITGINNAAGNVTVKNTGTLQIPTLDHVSATGTASLIVSSDITVNQYDGASVSGSSVVISAGGNFINLNTFGAFSVSGGRWLVYSNTPGGDTFSGLLSGNFPLWNKTYASYGPASVTETGNRYLFSFQPALAAGVTGGNIVKTYGTAVSPPGTTITGLVNAATYGGVFTQESYSGSGVSSTSGLAATDPIGSYTLSFIGSLTAPTGYGSTTYNSATVTVNPASLNVTANAANKTYDGLAYSGGNGVVYSGFVNGETSAVLGGALSYGGTSQGAVNAGSYAITPGGLTSGNYTISYGNGALTVNPAALSVTANAVGKTYDGLAYSGGNGVVYSGFVNGETSAVLGGALSYGGTSQGAINAGSYAITPGGLTSGNYTISYGNGALTINPAALSVTANAADKTYDGLAYSGGNGVVYSGFVNGETSAVLGGALSYGGTSQGAVNAGSYVITPGGLTSGKYTIRYTNGALTVKPALLTVTANAISRIFGVADPVLSGSVTGFVLTDTLANATTGREIYTSAASIASNVGSYAITGSGLTANNGNYRFVQAPSNSTALTIKPSLVSTWISAVGGDWDVPGNWAGNFIPQAGASVIIPALAGQTITQLGGNTAIRTLNAATSLNLSGGVFSLGSTLADTSVVGPGAILNLAGATFTLNGTLNASALSLSGGILNGSGVLNVTGNFNQSMGQLAGTLQSLTLNSTGNFNLTQSLAATQSISLSSGGAIINAAPAGTINLSAPSVQLTAATGIGGAAAPLQLATASLNATTVAGGGSLYNTPSAPVTLINFTTNDASSLSYSQFGQALTLTGIMSSMGGNLLIDPPTDLTLNAGSGMSSGGGAIGLLASGNILLSSLNAGTGAVNITTTGGMIGSSLPAGQSNITAGSVTARAVNGAQFSFNAPVANISSTGGTILVNNLLNGMTISNASLAATPSVLDNVASLTSVNSMAGIPVFDNSQLSHAAAVNLALSVEASGVSSNDPAGQNSPGNQAAQDTTAGAATGAAPAADAAKPLPVCH